MVKKEYSREDVTVVWQPELCIHSTICAKGLPQVFDPNRRPWVDMSQAESEAIVNQVNQCPSGALSIKKFTEASSKPQVNVRLMSGGPAVVKGPVEVIDESGEAHLKENVAFCRCTKSQKFPYCDGSHNH